MAFFRLFTRYLQEQFWIFLLAAIVAAFVFPDFGRVYLQPLALPSILLQMYIIMLNIETRQLYAALRQWKAMARALGLIFLFTPPLAFLGPLFFDPAIVLGLALLCTLPAGMSSPFFALRFGGNAALAVVVTTVSHLLLPVIAPLWVKLVAGGILQVDALEIFLRLAQIVFLPFLLAVLTRYMLGSARAERVYRQINWTTGLFVFIVTWGIVAEITVATVPLMPLVVFTTALNGLLFTAGYFLGGAHARTLTMTSGYRNVTLGMVIAISVWGDPVVALPSIVWTLTHTLFAILLLFAHSRSTVQPNLPVM
jgi:bile acid:Na+ symporter, BASS family